MSKVWDELSDEECITLYREGNEAIMNYLIERYSGLIQKKVSTLFIIGGDEQDLFQEGRIGVFKAIRDYDPGRDASFYTFADLCISRSIYTAIQKSNRDKHIPLNSYISLYYSENDELEDTIGEEKFSTPSNGTENDNNPEQIVINDEALKTLENYINGELSDFEKQVLDLHVAGIPYKEIARILGVEEKSADNCLQRIKAKIRKFKKDKK